MKKNRIYLLLTNPAFISLFLLTLNFIIGTFPMNNDEGIWSYIGRAWSQNGIIPYIGTVENKTPGIFELYAISYSLFGINYIFVRVLGILAVLVSSFLLYLIGKRIYSHLAGVFSMYVFGLTMSWDLLAGSFISCTEIFMILFSISAFYFILKGENSCNRRYWLLLAGTSIGISIAFKQIAIATTLALFLFYIFTNQSKKNKIFEIILFFLGILFSTLLSVLPLLLSGLTFKDYFEGAWLILLNSGSSASFSQHAIGFLSCFLFSRIVIFYPFLIVILLHKDLIKNKYFVGLLIWLLFDFIGVNSSGYYYGHQIKQLLPSFSIIIGILLCNLLLNLKSIEAYTKYISILLTITIIVLFPEKDLFKKSYFNAFEHPVDHNKEIGVLLRNNTKSNDHIYIMGSQGNAILYYSERISSSRYFSSIFLTSSIEREIVLADLKAKPPVYILKPNSKEDKITNIDKKIENFITNNYSFQRSKYNYDIFKRN